MAKTASLYIRIDPEIKAEVEGIYARYGMSLTDAINVFIYQSRNVGGLPFDLRDETPNVETPAPPCDKRNARPTPPAQRATPVWTNYLGT
jgi:DNA-damage-inducible protein J